MDWTRLIDEHEEWTEHNFPDALQPLEGVLGVIEELGELTHAHLKALQNIRGTEADLHLQAQDAVADMTIYLLGVMHYYQVQPPDDLRKEHRSSAPYGSPSQLILLMSSCIGRMAKAQSARTGSSLGFNVTISNLVRDLVDYCDRFGWDYETIVNDTWEQVKQRDWILYPATGFPPVGLENSVTVNKDGEPELHGGDASVFE